MRFELREELEDARGLKEENELLKKQR